ncbi:NUDIX domain-containing protein [Specibacter sp. NPDC078692]|uniref:NUDIX hydrolase n=1 Tax=Specibacter sp. NPDC078692 TaxID=3155818 RepID=UPI00343A6678
MTSSHELPTDQHGKTLQDYPRPSVAVDTALLTAHDGGLKVLLVHSPGGGWALPGTFLHPGERLADAVLRSLREKAGVTGRSPQQLHVFDEPGRDARGWVLSVAHVDVLPASALLEPLNSERATVVAVEEIHNCELPYDHAQIIGFAVEQVRSRYATTPDPAGLLKESFTLKELREVHEAVLGEALQRDTFRRSMERELEATGEMSDGTQGRPAALFRVRRG